MQQTQLKWIAQWYQQASDYVMAFSGQWELLWQNRPCPMLQNITDFGSFFPFSPNDKASSRTSTICHIGELYRVHCDRNLTDGTPLFLVRIDALPYTDLSMENQEWCNDMENRLAAMRSQIFGISNAVAALYCAIEEQSDACPRTLLEEQMQQLNIIKGNCCRLIRPTVLLAEQMRYCQKKDISGSPFFLDREMSNFVESSRIACQKKNPFPIRNKVRMETGSEIIKSGWYIPSDIRPLPVQPLCPHGSPRQPATDHGACRQR